MTYRKKKKLEKLIAVLIPTLVVVGFITTFAVINIKKKLNEPKDTASSSSSSSSSSEDEGATPNAPAIIDGGVDIGKTFDIEAKEKHVTMKVYCDYMAKSCSQFFNGYKKPLMSAIKSKKLSLLIYPVSPLNNEKKERDYSSRVGSALYSLAQGKQEKFWAFSNALLSNKNQPKEKSDGLLDSEIAKIAVSTGVESNQTDMFKMHLFDNYVKNTTKKIKKEKSYSGVPYIIVSKGNDGKKMYWKDWSSNISESALRQLISTVLSGGSIG